MATGYFVHSFGLKIGKLGFVYTVLYIKCLQLIYLYVYIPRLRFCWLYVCVNTMEMCTKAFDALSNSGSSIFSTVFHRCFFPFFLEIKRSWRRVQQHYSASATLIPSSIQYVPFWYYRWTRLEEYKELKWYIIYSVADTTVYETGLQPKSVRNICKTPLPLCTMYVQQASA